MDNTGNKFIVDIARIIEKEKAVTASRMIHAIFDGIFKEKPNSIECAQGCNYCCNNTVHLTKTESKELSNAIRSSYGKQQMDTLKTRLKVIRNSHQKMTREERMLERSPCPLLSEGSCSVYDSRPLFCRSAFSYSKKMCEEANVNPELDVPMEAGAKAMAEDFHVGILLGERKDEYELTLVEGLQKEFKW